MNKSPAFQFYASDFLVDTAEMTNQEVGVYIRLLSHQWVNGNLNGDPKRLANIVGMDLLDVWDEIKQKFDLGQDGKLRNPKLEKVRQSQINYRNQQSEAGKLGAAKRWKDKTDSTPIGDPIGYPNSENIALQSSSSSSVSQKKARKKFVKPEVSEVVAYCLERNNAVDADRFINHYTSNGWKVGKNPMKDWKAAVRTWEQSNGQNKQARKQSLSERATQHRKDFERTNSG